ncbi:MAG: hypothetical protein ACLRNQ_06780 [Flavonifractor plautii]
MTNQEIFELMARFDASTATTLKLSTKDFSLELGKGGPAAPIPAAAPVPAPAAAVSSSGCSSACGQVHHRPPGGHLLRRLRPRSLLPLCRWATM